MLFSHSDELLHFSELDELAKIRGEQGPVFSLYLDLREGTQPPETFERLLREAGQQRMLDSRPADYRQQWAAEAQRIRRWLEREAPPPGTPGVQGAAVLSSGEARLWYTLLLPAPVMDRLETGFQPHLRPLQILLAETPLTMVALVGPDAARLVIVSLGYAREIEQLDAVPVTGDVYEDPFIRYVAERIRHAWQHESFARLIIAGPEEARQALREQLTSELGESMDAAAAGAAPGGALIEVDNLSPQAGEEEILDTVRQINAGEEKRLEAERAAELIERAEKGQRAVLGIEQVLLAVRSKKIRMLVIEEDFHRPGGECPNCGFLSEDAVQPCLVCGVALRPEADVIEVALKRVIDQGGEIEILRSPGSRRALARHGRIGALLKEAQTPPPVRSFSNAATLAQGGKINPEAIYDEAVEESFPASDPPGNW